MHFLRNSVLLVGNTKPGPSLTKTHRKPLSGGCTQAQGGGEKAWKVLQEKHPHSREPAEPWSQATTPGRPSVAQPLPMSTEGSPGAHPEVVACTWDLCTCAGCPG
ncbi:hypothetical protein P7K49_015007, partial [Saguinus oedipus]